MKKLYSLIVALMVSAIALAQTTGKVVDADTNEPLPGATVLVKGTKTGVVTGFDGTFSIAAASGDVLAVSYLGYESQEVAASNNVTVKLQSSFTALKEVALIANVAVDRRTPVAYSTLQPKDIAENYGSKELPEVLNATPAVYATKSGGGFGDSRINIRGFAQNNVAVMINGIPVNDMENGWVYWSNWAGLGDAVSSIQVQRGLGASKMAINSVGGTINMITKSTEAKRSTFAQFDVTSFGRIKALWGFNSGRTENNEAFSVVLSRTQGDGYVQGTFVDAYSYFFSYSKEFNNQHRVVFTGIGAPQEHGQRTTMMTRAEYDKFGTKYNKDLGYLNGEEYNTRINYYHKPQFALNHYWTIDDDTSLKTSAYFSFGHGGGSGGLGSYAKYDKNGHLNYDDIYNMNRALGKSSSILRNSVNNHKWVGVLSTLDKKLSDNYDLTLGVDARSYLGEHFREVRDLIGGKYWMDSFKYSVDGAFGRTGKTTVDSNATSYWNVFAVTPYDNRIAYDNDGLVKYLGGFGQLEYTNDAQNFNWFVAGSYSVTDNTRIDRWNYQPIHNRQTSETVSIDGYNAKLGFNYNISDKANIFGNAGKYSRAPFFSFLFQNYANDVSDNIVNEEVDALELGYGYKTKNFAAKINAYSTQWTNKTLLSGNIVVPGGVTRALLQGIGADHKGVEIEFNAGLTEDLTLGGIASFGDWKWTGDVAYELRSDVDQSITKGFAYTDGLKVGDSPQTQIGGKMRWQATEALDFGATYVFNDNLYASYDPSAYNTPEKKVQPYELDPYGMLDLRAGLKVGKGYFQLQINNALDYDGFVEGVNNADGSDIRYGFPAWGRNSNLSYKITF